MRKPLALLTLLTVASAACTDDDAAAVRASESGRWEVVRAIRNHRPTGLLDAAYLRFDTAAHRVTTNITGEELELPYALADDGRRIMTSGSAVLKEFEVAALTDTTMVLQSEMMSVPFTLHLRPVRE